MTKRGKAMLALAMLGTLLAGCALPGGIMDRDDMEDSFPYVEVPQETLAEVMAAREQAAGEQAEAIVPRETWEPVNPDYSGDCCSDEPLPVTLPAPAPAEEPEDVIVTVIYQMPRYPRPRRPWISSPPYRRPRTAQPLPTPPQTARPTPAQVPVPRRPAAPAAIKPPPPYPVPLPRPRARISPPSATVPPVKAARTITTGPARATTATGTHAALPVRPRPPTPVALLPVRGRK